MESPKKVKTLRNEFGDLLLHEAKTKLLCAKDAMIKPVLLSPDDDVEKILGKLRKEHVNTCIVVTKEKKFLGEISDNDIIKLFLQQVKSEPLVQMLNRGYRREFLYKNAKEMMNNHAAVVQINTPINDVVRLIQKKGFEYMPVLDNTDKVVGVITPSSMINLLKKY